MAFPVGRVTPKWTPEKKNDRGVDPLMFMLSFCAMQGWQAEASVFAAKRLGLLRDDEDKIYTPRQFHGLVRSEKKGEKARAQSCDIAAACARAQCHTQSHVTALFKGMLKINADLEAHLSSISVTVRIMLRHNRVRVPAGCCGTAAHVRFF